MNVEEEICAKKNHHLCEDMSAVQQTVVKL